MNIAVVGTGGTISSTTAPGRDVALPDLRPDDILTAAGGAAARVTTVDLLHEGSNALTLKHVQQIVAEVRRQFDAGADAAVIMQGTATLQETSYLYDLLLGDCPPVVCTGAMRPMSDLSPDGPPNLRDALLLAEASVGIRRGVYVVIDGGVHAPIDVLKLHGARSAGFDSPGVGVLGWVDGGEVRMRRERRPRRRTFTGLVPGVELLTATLEASPLLIDCAADTPSVTGLVVGGFPGRGAVPDTWMPALQRYAATERPLVFTVTSLTGRAIAKHGAKATARHLADLGAVVADDLAPVKTRCLLMAVLSETRARDDVAKLIREELAWA